MFYPDKFSLMGGAEMLFFCVCKFYIIKDFFFSNQTKKINLWFRITQTGVRSCVAQGLACLTSHLEIKMSPVTLICNKYAFQLPPPPETAVK